MLAVLSLRFQRIHLYQLRRAGVLTPVMVIGDFCFPDDAMYLSQTGVSLQQPPSPERGAAVIKGSADG